MFYTKSRRACGPSAMVAMWGHGQRGWGGRPGREGGGGRRRMFDGSELRLILLKLIADTPRHGYDLIREIEELSGGSYAPSAGVVYPTLTLLADMELIAPSDDGARKLFAITDAGSAHLAEQAEHVAAVMAKLAAMAARREQTDAAPVRRAMGGLREALQHRLSRDDASAEKVHAAAAILDEAAQRIERL